MIKTYRQGSWIKQGNLVEALGIRQEENPVLSLVGGGGKTTSCRRLMKDFCQLAKTPIVTTTTHMQKEEGSYYIGEEDLRAIEACLKREGKVWAGKSCGDSFMKSFDLAFVSEMTRLQVPVIIEADGAKMMPCKIPAEKEPVILPETTHLLAVYGLDAIGKPLKESCFRLDLVKAFLGKEEEDRLLPEDLVKIAGSRLGGKKGLTDGMDYQVILNKADDPMRQAYADQIASGLAAAGVAKVHMTSFLMGDLTLLKNELLGGTFS
ncbi:MAG: putative selenium-dependent hydroxylase accessory protein YqeC [Dorea sp.]|nr:putative selenium-dependent hydroxylase accessory protein YqeC [Dorea sp.]